MKKHFFNWAWYFIILCLCLASSCRPEKPEEKKYMGTYPLGDIKDYQYFKPGSMWVYECDSTGDLDTQIMISCDTPWFKKDYIKYQLLLCSYKSINEGSTYQTFFPSTDIPYSDNFKWTYSHIISHSNSINKIFGNNLIFFSPFDTGITAYFNSPVKFIGLLTDYKVLGTNYDTVRVFQVQYGASFPEPSIRTTGTGQTTYYWAKGVGIVRVHVWTAKDGNIGTFKFNWNLKSYNIN